MPLPSLAEITFSCTLCGGPLIAWESDAGRTTDCPHCHKPLTIPTREVAPVVNKDTFEEPQGLRRILQEVRDSEWEVIRRKLQETRGRVTALETELREVKEEKALAAANALAGGTGAPEQVAVLRQQLAEMSARSDETSRVSAVHKQQQEAALQRMREALDAIRAEVGPLREENAAMLKLLQEARQEIEQERQGKSMLQEELTRAKARSSGRRSMPSVAPIVA